MELRELFVLLAACALLVVALRHASLVRDLAEALENIFRGGGPGSPMHPSPANDAALLRRRATKAKN